MALIEAHELVKTYRVAVRHAGAWGAVRGLVSREYRTVRALDGVSFAVREGELVGYIGPNGAGKSTTVKVLAGILVPDAGDCRIMGRIPWGDRVTHVADIGVVFGQRTQLWWDLPVIESFDLLSHIYALPRSAYRQMRDLLVERMGVSPLLDTPVRQLSLGQRMRCDLVAALLHRPRILFLDEPTIGLDAVSKLAVREFVRELCRDDGVTVILTTHDMDDIEALCSRVLLINRGRLLLDGSIEDLRAQAGHERRLSVELVDPNDGFDDPDCVLIDRQGTRVRLAFDPTRVSTAELIGRITARHAIGDLIVEDPPIEETVARIYRREASDDALV